MLGYQACSLTNFSDNLNLPAIAAGSKVEIAGALFDITGDEAISGWGPIANSSNVYIMLTVSGAAFTASFVTAAPTWDTAKQGWYSGLNRYIGGLYKDSGGNYTKKWLYRASSGGVQNLKEYGDGTIEILGALTVDGDILFPGVSPGAQLNLWADFAGPNDSSTVYVKHKEIFCPVAGTFTVQFDLAADGSHSAYGRVYKNGAAAGTERSQTSASFTTYSENITVSVGDRLQLYQHTVAGGFSSFTRNFRLYSAQSFPTILGAILESAMKILDA
jgi:hypothetical protein